MVTLVNKGVEQAAKLLVGVTNAKPQKWVQVGTGEAPESEDQTELDNALVDSGLERKEGSSFFEEPSTGGVVATIGPNTGGETIVVNEVGLFDEDENMSLRHKYATGRPLDPGDSIEITFKIESARMIEEE